MKTFFNNSRTTLILTAFVSVFSFAVSFTPVFAQTTGCAAQTAQSGYLPNPLCVTSISAILYLVVDIATYIGVVLAIIFIIYAGFKYIAARGNPEKITEAHHFLLAVIIGIAILIGASAIVNVIENTLTSAGVVNNSTFSAPTSQSTTAAAAPSAATTNTNTQTQSVNNSSANFVGGGGSFGGGGAGTSF